MSFQEKLRRSMESNKSLVCIGLDPDPSLIPIPDIRKFLATIIDVTKDLVCAYKPNLAFYESLGLEGFQILEETITKIPSEIPVIGDAKRGDIANSSQHYAKTLFDIWGFDAVTINPFGGQDSVQPFLDYKEKGIFLWCRSSNPGAWEFQDLKVLDSNTVEAKPLYEWIALRSRVWNEAKNVGLVVGATYPDELKRIRNLCPEMPILIPGVGTQSGALESSVSNGVDSEGKNALINLSRSVLYASKHEIDFAQAAREEAENIRQRINNQLIICDKNLEKP
ncbi:orotidine-5'-phosphate decarboxylase [SAR202 cluster bacterium AD-802-E10_MRT_200m]|nr:orotidine-5'-phosphate decarboxylase [SAR202 cluster bacterium AD-802-E10_MRT_200m]